MPKMQEIHTALTAKHRQAHKFTEEAMKATLIALVAVLVICSSSQAGDRAVLSDSSYGVIHFGTNMSSVESRLKEKAKSDTDEYDCSFVTFKKYPGIMFMVEKGIITRADVASKSIPNVQRIKIGTPLTEVKQRYPKAIIMPHKYDEKGHYVIFKSPDGKRAMVFEETEGKIGSVRAGLEPSAEYVEGCL